MCNAFGEVVNDEYEKHDVCQEALGLCKKIAKLYKLLFLLKYGIIFLGTLIRQVLLFKVHQLILTLEPACYLLSWNLLIH